MQYHVKEVKYADGASTVSVYPQTVNGRKSSANPLPLAYSPFDGQPIYSTFDIRSPEEAAYLAEKSKADAVARAKKKVEAIGRCNKWQYFITLTFSPEKVNSFDYDACAVAIKYWLDCQRRRNPNMAYLLVFEPHQSGRYHVHGLISNVDWKLNYVKRNVYNLDDSVYDLGFTTVSKVLNSGACATYISKYIVKTLDIIPVGRKRYWSSHNLVMLDDVTTYYLFEDIDDGEFAEFIDLLYAECDCFRWQHCPGNNKPIGYFNFFKKGVLEENERKDEGKSIV